MRLPLSNRSSPMAMFHFLEFDASDFGSFRGTSGCPVLPSRLLFLFGSMFECHALIASPEVSGRGRDSSHNLTKEAPLPPTTISICFVMFGSKEKNCPVILETEAA